MVRTVVTMLLVALLAGWGCASGSGQAEPSEKSASGMAAVPDDSPLAKITVGMDDSEVRKVLGEPTSQNAYMTGKSWIPFYFGPDTTRTDYLYDGIGRVIFSRNQYSGKLSVIDLRHDASKAGE
jgi:hypothetical protein